MPLKDVSNDDLPKLPNRAEDSHKGDFGRVLVIGGSRGMAGAPALSGMAAMRSGAGLVSLAVPGGIQATVASFEPAYMTIGCGDDKTSVLTQSHSEKLLEVADGMSAVALGPGMGTEAGTVELVHSLLNELKLPVVLDADGLNALSKEISILKNSPASRILTPHPGEFARLAGEKCGESDDSRITHAAELAQQGGAGNVIVVLKGHRTVVTDGKKHSLNTTGNAGMATGGTGDCLTGMIVALVAQGLEPFDAARLGAHVHGLAGDLAAAELGKISMTAQDLIAFLPTAFQ